MEEIISKIECNKIKCKKCGDIIESKTRHDFKRCTCKSVAVDGGHDYLRRIGNKEDIEDLSFIRKLVKIDTVGYEVIKDALCKKEVPLENIHCPICNSKNISIKKSDGELITGDDAIALICHNCKKVYGFSDLKYKNEKYRDI